MGDDYTLLIAECPVDDADTQAAIARLWACDGEPHAVGVVVAWSKPVIAAILCAPALPGRTLLAELSKLTGKVWGSYYHSSTDSGGVACAESGVVVTYEERTQVEFVEEPCEWMAAAALGEELSPDDLWDEVESVSKQP